MAEATAAVTTPGTGDAAAIAALCNRLSRELYDTADINEQEVRHWFTLPDLAMFVARRHDRLSAYADIRRDDDGRRFYLDLRVDPQAWGSGAADGIGGRSCRSPARRQTFVSLPAGASRPS